MLRAAPILSQGANDENTLVNFGDDIIVITGENFDFGPGPLEVSLGDVDNPAAGDITADCVAGLF